MDPQDIARVDRIINIPKTEDDVQETVGPLPTYAELPRITGVALGPRVKPLPSPNNSIRQWMHPY